MKNILTKKSENFPIKKLDWSKIQLDMKEKLGNDIYESWLKKIDFTEEFNNYILISVSTRFIRDWIVSRYLDQILQIIKTHKKDINRIEFTIIEQKNNKASIENKNFNYEDSQKVSFIKDSFFQYNRIDPNKKFENFIIGPSNKLAFEASKKVSEDLSHYNPLYLYGGVGMGKTHLLNAIGLEIKSKQKVMFISAERFMYQFVKSIKSNEMVKFKDYFRNTDVLLIDDIQFMNGKEAMQEEFFHTFNALIDKGSQVIVSADRAPNKLSRIQERIKSRFAGGLVIDIQNPDYELRYNIVKAKINELKLNQSISLDLSEEIKKFISSEIRTSIRELVGALNRIISFSRIYNKLPTLPETKTILKDLLNLSENKVTIDLIQTIVCQFFKISKNEMLSARRSRYLVRPRQTAIYLTKLLTSKSLPEIGRSFSNRDHTTVIHSVKTIERLRQEDKDLNLNIDNLKNKILYNKENEI
jgi:chromosomal replication initiator protein